MNERIEPIDPSLVRERGMRFSFETTKVDNVIYDVRKLEKVAETIPIQEFPLSAFDQTVKLDHHFWLDADGKTFGPGDILLDWDAAQKNSAWSEHVETIKNPNFDRPIWVTKDGNVFNGLHRLTAAFIQRKSTIKVRVFETLPSSAQVKEN